MPLDKALFHGESMRGDIRDRIKQHLAAAGLTKDFNAFYIGDGQESYKPLHIAVSLQKTDVDKFNEQIGKYLTSLSLPNGKKASFTFHSGLLDLNAHPAIYDVMSGVWFKKPSENEKPEAVRQAATNQVLIPLDVASVTMLKEFLDEVYPFEFLIDEDGKGNAVITTFSEGIPRLRQVLEHFWEIGPTTPEKYFRKSEKQEKIKSAAVRLPDDTIVEGLIHILAVQNAFDQGLLKKYGVESLDDWEDFLVKSDRAGGVDWGFTTSTGRFVDREEADTIARLADQHADPENEEVDNSLDALHLKGNAEELRKRNASAYIKDVELSKLPLDTQQDVFRFVEEQPGLKGVEYGIVVAELLPKVDQANWESALKHVDREDKEELSEEVHERLTDKWVLLVNDKIVDGHHFLAKAHLGGVTNSLQVLDLTPCRFQAALRTAKGKDPAIDFKNPPKEHPANPAWKLVTPQQREEGKAFGINIPPSAWDVKIKPNPANPALLVKFRDRSGREQYLYDPAFRAKQDEAKFEHLDHVRKTIPTLQKQLDSHLKQPEMSREKALATIVSIINETAMRVGSEQFAGANGTYGASSLRKDHVKLGKDKQTVSFNFVGKHGIVHQKVVKNPAIWSAVSELLAQPGDRLFGTLTEKDVQDYLRPMGIKPHNLRTFNATKAAAEAFLAQPSDDPKERKRIVKEVAKQVSEHLGNTPSMALKSYISPAVVNAYLSGKLKDFKKQSLRLSAQVDQFTELMQFISSLGVSEELPQEVIRELEMEDTGRVACHRRTALVAFEGTCYEVQYENNNCRRSIALSNRHAGKLVRRLGRGSWDTGSYADFLGKLQRNELGGAGELAYGDRIRFRRPSDYAHGTLEFFPGGGKPYVATWSDKGEVTPKGGELFGSLEEALQWLDKEGFTQRDERVKKKIAPTPKAPKQNNWEIDRPTVEVEKRALPSLDTKVDETHTLRDVANAAKEIALGRKQLQKYGLDLWSPDGSWYAQGISGKDGAVYKYGSPEYDVTLYGHARELADKLIPLFRQMNVLYPLATKYDPTGTTILPHQQPRDLEKMEGYTMHVVKDKAATDGGKGDWTKESGFNGHAQTAILQDEQGNKYLTVFEVQATYGKPDANMTYNEIYRRLAASIAKQAKDAGLPVVLATARTAQDIYGREEFSPTFTRAYSKGGVVRKAFNEVLGEPVGRVQLEELSMSWSDKKRKFEGVLYPTTGRAGSRAAAAKTRNAGSAGGESWISGFVLPDGKVIAAPTSKEHHYNVLWNNKAVFQQYVPMFPKSEAETKSEYYGGDLSDQLDSAGIFDFSYDGNDVFMDPSAPKALQDAVAKHFNSRMFTPAVAVR